MSYSLNKIIARLLAKQLCNIILILSWLILTSAIYKLNYVNIITATLISLLPQTILYYLNNRISETNGNIINKFNNQAIKYLFWLIKEIITSSISIIKIIILSKNEPKYNITEIESFEDDFKNLLYANSITLTPGTITIDAINNSKLTIHAINNSFLEDLRNTKENRVMFNKIDAIVN
ncbi:MAG TPA: Na+/H+ antiporter subunit E [Candidatus Megaira endosymbiont of Hartmannula sinica]|nr:Na+/H+ antiporter subunit E [Candidatus Megaera endosymbiont of Hartmannula sinica]